MNKISVVINTFNEEKNLPRCLESVKWANEIVIVDMHSTDDSVNIAKKYTKNIYSHKNTGFVEPARNFAISKATGDWILVLDADEEVPPSLSEKLLEIEKDNNLDFVKIARKNIIFGKWIEHTGWWPDYLIRFFKKGSVVWTDKIHSMPSTKGKGTDLDQKYSITHYSYDTILQFITKGLENYAKAEAGEKIKSGYVFNYKDAIRFPINEFLSRFFARKGYKDGLHGLMLSILMAFYHFLVFSYIWEKKGFVNENRESFLEEVGGEIKKSEEEIGYWIKKEKYESIRNPIKKTLAKIKGKF